MTLAVEHSDLVRGNGTTVPAQPFGVVPSSRIAKLRCDLRPVHRAEIIPEDDRQVRNYAKQNVRERQRLGLRYERVVLTNIAKYLPEVLGGPWIRFRAERENGVCQPDGLWYNGGGRALVIEVKLTHTLDAWHQLRGKYVPVTRALYGIGEVQILNVVRAFDRSIPWPEDQLMFDNMEHALSNTSLGYRVLVWRGN